MKWIVVWALMIFLPNYAKASGNSFPVYSPDRKYHITVTEIPVETGDPYAYDLVQVFRGNEKIAEDPLKQSEKGMAKSIYDSGWSSNSRFFVFLTKEVNGHSGWHSPTTAYDTVTNKFIELDDRIGAVVSDHVLFTGPDVLKIRVMGPDGAYGTPLVKEVSLSKLAEQK
jgi:hypothetical protein